MHLALLAAADSWYSRDLVRAAAADYRVTPMRFSQLSGNVASDGCSVGTDGFAINDADAVLVRTMPPGSLEQVVFRMDALAALERNGTFVINPPKSMEAAVDKFLTSELLGRAGLKIPQTICCQTSEEALDAFELLGGDVVVKPLFGGEGRGITRITDRDLAVRAFRMLEQMQSIIYLQPFIAHHGYDVRVFLLGDDVETCESYCIKRTNHDDWRSNVSRGATTEVLELTDEFLELSHRAARAIGAPIVGVDLLPAQDGSVYVLEVNAVPGWRALAKTVDVDIARRVLDYVAARVATRSKLTDSAPVTSWPGS